MPVESGVLLHTLIQNPRQTQGCPLPYVASDFEMASNIQPAVWRREVCRVSPEGVSTTPGTTSTLISVIWTHWAARRAGPVCQGKGGRRWGKGGCWLSQRQQTVWTVPRQNCKGGNILYSFSSNKLLKPSSLIPHQLLGHSFVGQNSGSLWPALPLRVSHRWNPSVSHDECLSGEHAEKCFQGHSRLPESCFLMLLDQWLDFLDGLWARVCTQLLEAPQVFPHGLLPLPTTAACGILLVLRISGSCF